MKYVQGTFPFEKTYITDTPSYYCKVKSFGYLVDKYDYNFYIDRTSPRKWNVTEEKSGLSLGKTFTSKEKAFEFVYLDLEINQQFKYLTQLGIEKYSNPDKCIGTFESDEEYKEYMKNKQNRKFKS